MDVKANRHDVVLKESFLSPFRRGYCEIDGVTLPEHFQDFIERILNMEVFEDDIWICSYPKTGTTWTQEMIFLLASNFDYKAAEEPIQTRFPFIEVSGIFDLRGLIETKTNCNFEEIVPHFTDSVKFTEDMDRPRFIKTHLPWNLMPKQIQTGQKNPKIIYVSRSPKQTCLSYYHHSKLLEGFKGTLHQFEDLFLAGKVPFGSIWSHTRDFWQIRDDKVLFLKYEDLVKDLPLVINQTCVFLNKDINEEQMKVLVRHLSFAAMKVNKAVNYENVVNFLDQFDLVKKSDGSSFIRAGGQNKGNKEYLSDTALEKIKINDEKYLNKHGLYFH